eukprot:TRINITY_DN867_c0_g1_i1.p1 TRINITY_DN867_c0_g1~~TRINITY_DN867_c0_g1_i1.p1  ORF type:complete len:290 (-),score=70.13 TRINITY_DN867_c0_g1_i1:5-829(-)
MASNSPIQISSLEEHNRILASQGQSLIVHFFWADWSEPCRQIDEVIDALAREYSSCTFVKVEAERYPDVTEKYPVRAVPSFVFVKGGRVLDTVEGANVPAVVAAVKRYSTSGVDLPPSLPAESTTPPKVDLNTRLEQLVKAHRVMLFMKGTPDTPRCGFSREMINLMKSVNVQFGSFDILKDDEVRQGLKAFSNWPTYPQLYVDGKLIGGLDICKELQSNNELADIFPEEVRKPDLNTRLHQLINKQRVMIFIKGTPQTPQCALRLGIQVSLLV